MEGNVGNRRNDHHHESHHHHHENHHHHDHHPHHQIPWNFSQEPSTSIHLPPFGQLSTSSSSPPLSSFNNQNNHHHHFDAFLHSPPYLPVEAKTSQPFLFPSTDLLDSDFPHHSPGAPSDSLTLKLGKRHYYENVSSGALGKLSPADEPHVSGFSLLKRGREFLSHFNLHHQHHHFQHQPSLASSTPQSMLASGAAVLGAPVPRCQVEGCNVALMGAKEYHRRHKVCEMHSKAPKVVVQGLEQRFCQQCSRFHVVSEFDDSKRSCRRRLAGHNERRRKSSSDSITKNSSQEGRGVGGRLPSARNTSTSSSAGRALSLLSSESSPTWSSPAAAAPADDDLSSRSSAALRELIAENRAAALAKQLVSPDDGPLLPHDYPGHGHGHQPLFMHSRAALRRHAQPHQFGTLEPLSATTAATTTLELMQATHVQPQDPSYQLMTPRSGRLGAGEDEDSIECEIWRSIE